MRDTGDKFRGRRHRSFPPQPAWLQRLWQQQQVPVSKDKLHWWGVHVQNFLTAVRREQWQGSVKDLVERFLGELEQTTPALPLWRQRQVRQALEVFARGIDHWHFKPEAGGRVRPAFRLKTTVEAAGQPQQETPSAAEASPVLSERHWREQMIATLRLRSCESRTWSLIEGRSWSAREKEPRTGW